VRETEVMPGPKATAEEVRELARLCSASFGHAVGTCKMGVDNLAVVAFSRAKQGRLDLVKKLAGIEPMRTLEIAPLPWLHAALAGPA
jgi:hypothetical protein